MKRIILIVVMMLATHMAEAGTLTPNDASQKRGLFKLHDSVEFAEITAQGEQNVLPSDPMVEIPRGNIPGVSSELKFGRNQSVGTTEEDICETGVIYLFYPTTAIAVDIVSSNGGDTQDYQIFGLDGTGALQDETVTITGSSAVNLSNTYWRVFRIINRGTTDNAGTIVVAADGGGGGIADNVVAAIITIGINQTNMAIYTIPIGKTGFMTQYYASTDRGSGNPKSIDITLLVRPASSVSVREVFQHKNHQGLVSAGSSHFGHTFKPYFKIDALSDIKISGFTDTGTADVHAGFDLVLVDD